MPDLWEDLPVEMMGDRPDHGLLRKTIVKPKKLQDTERGKDAEEGSNGIHGSPEVK
tara:strand:- start:960 stop:1127 length:168 start_codon:yes stop_codon:yes gene_type:complete